MKINNERPKDTITVMSKGGLSFWPFSSPIVLVAILAFLTMDTRSFLEPLI